MNPFIIIWTLLVFLSIAWYAGLLFYIGFKGGKEILQMIKDLAAKETTPENPRP
jgi:hypothetical protein